MSWLNDAQKQCPHRFFKNIAALRSAIGTKNARRLPARPSRYYDNFDNVRKEIDIETEVIFLLVTDYFNDEFAPLTLTNIEYGMFLDDHKGGGIIKSISVYIVKKDFAALPGHCRMFKE